MTCPTILFALLKVSHFNIGACGCMKPFLGARKTEKSHNCKCQTQRVYTELNGCIVLLLPSKPTAIPVVRLVEQERASQSSQTEGRDGVWKINRHVKTRPKLLVLSVKSKIFKRRRVSYWKPIFRPREFQKSALRGHFQLLHSARFGGVRRTSRSNRATEPFLSFCPQRDSIHLNSFWAIKIWE